MLASFVSPVGSKGTVRVRYGPNSRIYEGYYVRVDAIPIHFYLQCPIPKIKPWEYEIQSDKPHANVCVFAIPLPGIDGRIIKLVGLHV